MTQDKDRQEEFARKTPVEQKDQQPKEPADRPDEKELERARRESAAKRAE